MICAFSSLWSVGFLGDGEKEGAGVHFRHCAKLGLLRRSICSAVTSHEPIGSIAFKMIGLIRENLSLMH